MAFRITFFKTPKPRVFHYSPIYWDPEKEEREERLNPQKRIEMKRGSFQKVMDSRRKTRVKLSDKITRIVIIIAVAALLGAFLYLTKFIEVVLQKTA